MILEKSQKTETAVYVQERNDKHTADKVSSCGMGGNHEEPTGISGSPNDGKSCPEGTGTETGASGGLELLLEKSQIPGTAVYEQERNYKHTEQKSPLSMTKGETVSSGSPYDGNRHPEGT